MPKTEPNEVGVTGVIAEQWHCALKRSECAICPIQKAKVAGGGVLVPRTDRHAGVEWNGLGQIVR